VLDFGLAKALGAAADSSLAALGTMSPTLSVGATYAGVILGTAAYMAPEQAKGKAADRRSDIWAFGVVLYEMLTGERRFNGDSVAETLASVMKDPLTSGSLPRETPPPIRLLVARCLERDVRRRLQSIGEARIVIDDAIAGAPGGSADAASASASRPAAVWLAGAVTALAVVVAIAALWWTASRPVPDPPAIARFTIPPPAGATITNVFPGATQLAVSPDGRYLAFVADEPGRARILWVRALESLIAQRLDRTEGADFPFWSPDSRNIGYFADGKLMRISIAGGSPLTVADATSPQGGAWGESEDGQGVIIFAPTDRAPLQRVLAQGGVPSPATMLADGQSAHQFPQFLPGSRRFLYHARGDTPGIFVQTLGADDATFVVDSIGRAMFSPPGFLLYLRDNTLLAHRWDPDRATLDGEPVSIAEDVRSGGANGRNAFSVSATGVLAYRAGGTGVSSTVVSYSRDGKAPSVILEQGDYGPIDLSPDNTRLLVVRGVGDGRDLWVKDLASGVFSRFTTAAGPETDGVWSPDSRRVAYAQGSKRVLYSALLGSGKHTLIPVAASNGFYTHDWTVAEQLVVHEDRIASLIPVPPEAGPPGAMPKPQAILNEPYTIDEIRVSPDGRWVAYMSTESGQPEIVVATFPSFTDRRQVSTGGLGAVQPVWRADGRELFFLSRDGRMMAAAVTPGTTLQTGPVTALFETKITGSPQVHFYDVTKDGNRFIAREPISSGPDAIEPLYVVTNWPAVVGR
jgi:Tol biopolymer transport system component